MLVSLEKMIIHLKSSVRGLTRVNSMVKISRTLAPFLLLIGIAASLTIVGELSGEFGQIRQLSSKPQNVLTITIGEFVSLNNSVPFGFDIDNGEDILKVRLVTNQTFSWHQPIEEKKRIFRSENFMLNATNCSFEVDITIESYDKQTQTLQIIDNTEPTS